MSGQSLPSPSPYSAQEPLDLGSFLMMHDEHVVLSDEEETLQLTKSYEKESSSSEDNNDEENEEEAVEEELEEEEEAEEVILKLKGHRPEGHVRIREQANFRDRLRLLKKPRRSSTRRMSLASISSAESLIMDDMPDDEGDGDLFTRYYEFFEHFWNIPTLEEIELSSTSDETIATNVSATSLASKKSKDSEAMKYGLFADNLDDISKDISSDEIVKELATDVADEEAHEEADEEDDYDSTFESSETDELLKKPSMDREENEEVPDDDRILALFSQIDVDNRQQEQDDIKSILELKRQEERNYTVGRFLDLLLHLVVNYCEEKDKTVLLRNDLDKMSIAQAMVESHYQLLEAQKKRLYLNRKVVEFYRRKRQFRPMTENIDTIAQDMTKYMEILQTLDVNLNRESLTRKLVDAQVNELQVESANLHAEAQQRIKEFEDCVRSTMRRETTDKNNRLNAVVEYMLRKKAAFSEEISKVRLKLILRQHLAASLKKNLEELEDLGNGLHMRDFERLNAETLNITKKIEERTAELKRMRTRCNHELHEMSHKRERLTMVRQTLGIQKSILKNLIDDKDDTRAWLHNLKLKRIKIRATIKEMSFQGGLIDKPALMKDYDETAAKSAETKARNDILKKKLADAQQRFQSYVDKLFQLDTRKSTG